MRAASGNTHRKILKEEAIKPIAGALLIALLTFGCGAAPEKNRAIELEEKVDKEQQKPLELGTGPGEFTFKSNEEGRRKLWTIRWKSAEINVSKHGHVSGRVLETSGSLIEDDQEQSTFTASHAILYEDASLLFLGGSVSLKSTKHKTELKCNVAIYKPDEKLIEASGGVRVIGEDYTMGPFDEILASPELKRVGTPGKFNEVKKSGR